MQVADRWRPLPASAPRRVLHHFLPSQRKIYICTMRQCCLELIATPAISPLLMIRFQEAHVTTIIAGLFQQQSEAENAVEELLHAGFGRAQISSFYVNPLGLRDVPPGKSRGAKESDRGVAMGAVAGAAVGATVAPFLGPVGAVTGGLVGAHVGGLAGSMSKMKEPGDTGDDVQDEENAAPVRHSGMLVAIGVADQQDEDRAINVLRSLGAGDIERAQGTLVDGDWSDFDPVAPPALIESLPEQPSASGPNQRV
jgi:hypothetical protein